MPPKITNRIQYARMWPREVFYHGREFLRDLDILGEPGVYVLYRDDVPYYVGQATRLRSRLWDHANVPGTRYYDFWNYFSVFVPDDPSIRSQIEAILIAAMPTENSARPRLHKVPFPMKLTRMLRDRLNPNFLNETAAERRAAAKKAAQSRKRRAAGRKAAATRKARVG